MKNRIINKIRDNFKISYLDVLDNSYEHSGHIGNPEGVDGTHFKIVIKFIDSNISIVDRHRSIKNILKDEFDDGLHALSIKVVK